MGDNTDDKRVTIGRRVPCIFKFQAFLSFGLGAWLFYPFPQSKTELMNAIKGAATVWLLTVVMFALYMNGRVSYTQSGFYIRPLGWRTLLGLAKEYFAAFDQIVSITPEFARRGGPSRADWLMFGILQLHTKMARDDRQELALYQAILDREQLVGILQGLADERPDLIDEQVIHALAAGA